MSGVEGKHTPGPWHIENKRGIANNMLRICSGLSGVARVNSSVHEEANACLIAAAPELLDALIAVMRLHCPYTGNPTTAQLVAHWEHEREQGNESAQVMLDALASITKATGETA